MLLLIISGMEKEENPRKEVYDPITGEWIPSELTEEDVYLLMQSSEKRKAEEQILRRIFLKTIGATDGWHPRER